MQPTELRVSHVAPILHSETALDYVFSAVAIGAAALALHEMKKIETAIFLKKETDSLLISAFAWLAACSVVVGGGCLYQVAKGSRVKAFLKDSDPQKILEPPEIARIMELSNRCLWKKFAAKMSISQIRQTAALTTNAALQAYLNPQSSMSLDEFFGE